MRVLVTGATGFVGRAVAHRLVAGGHAVTCLVRGAQPTERLARLGIRAETIAGDLLDLAPWQSALPGHDAVVHAAAVVAPRLQRDRETMRRTNRDGAIELARVAKDAGVRRFVFVSSIAAMGFWSGVATPESPCTPDTGYGKAKLDAERAILPLRSASFDVVVLRPPTVYGPGEPYNFLDWVRAVDRGLFFVIGDGENRFPLATTENVARAVLAAVEGRLPSGVNLVADREPYSMNRITSAICASLGRRPPRVRLPILGATLAGLGNEALRALSPRVPLFLSRARVRTLTVDQRMDVTALVQAGVPLDAPLEEWVALTIADYRSRGLIPDARRRS